MKGVMIGIRSGAHAAKVALMWVAFAVLAGCGFGSEGKRDRTRQPDPSGKYETSALACDAERYPNGNSDPLLFSRGYIRQPALIKPLDDAISPRPGTGSSQYDTRDRAALESFYDRYKEIANTASEAIEMKDHARIERSFDDSLALMREWGRSGIRQKYCERCDGAIRPAIAEIPVMISLRLFSLDGNRESYKSRIEAYLRLMGQVDNLHAPEDLSERRVISSEEMINSLYRSNILDQFDLHYALTLYYLMAGKDRHADKEWKLMTVGHRIYGNARFPMADNQEALIRDLMSDSTTPLDIVEISRIDSERYDVCSSLYRNFIEYLTMKSIYSPRYENKRSSIKDQVKEFLDVTDRRLFSIPMQRMIDDLVDIETTKSQGDI